MSLFIVLVLGLAAGAICTFVLVMNHHSKSQENLRDAARREQRAADLLAQQQAREAAVAAREQDLALREHEAEARLGEINKRFVTYEELRGENAILKRDLQNVDVNLNKLALDGELREKRQQELNRRSNELGRRYLADTVRFIGAALSSNNFAAMKERLTGVIHRCRDAGYEVTVEHETELIGDLKSEFEKAVRSQFEREEQARIKARIREEERIQREIDRELAQLERERAAIRAALDKALADAQNQHTEEVLRLQARLTEAEERSRRAMSMAQQTKAGHVYVISNIGSFGEGVFKVGMTRRLEPNERVRELCSAGIPFPFDVHLMAHSEDAPALENALHRELHKHRVNRMNPRKEFFRVDMATLTRIIEEHCGTVEFTADADALEYRQSLTMSEEDAAFVNEVYDRVDEEEETANVEI